MWDWIKAYNVPFYETFWGILGMKEYQFIYKKSVAREVNDILDFGGVQYGEEVENKIKEICYEVMQDAGIHFGHPYLNTATMAGVNRMMLKKLASFYGVPFPIDQEKDYEASTPWWME